jgi:hypothetical protein
MQTNDRQRHLPTTETVLVRSVRVVLLLWGFTDADVQEAETNARQRHFSSGWEIVDVIPRTGTPCPIPRHDPIALDQNAMYDAAWAAYRAGQAPP